MDAPPGRGTRRRRLPAGLLGLMALVAVGEGRVARRDLDLLAPWHWDWRVTGRAARREAVRADVLLVGDSLLKFGVVPRLVEARTGRRAYNLGLCIGQAPSSYFLLKRALDAGARPSAIVVDFAAHLLPPGPRFNGRQWPEMLDAAEALDLAWSARDGSLLAEVLVGRALPSVRSRPEIRAAALDALAGRRTHKRFETPRYLRNWRVNAGANVMAETTAHGDPEAWFRSTYAPTGWAPDAVNVAYARRLLALARSRGIRVYWLLPPPAPEAQELAERSGLAGAEERFVRAMQAEFPGLVVLDARRSRYPLAAHLDDPLHLTRPGAEALSDDVGTALAGARPRDRSWIDLPAYRPRAAAATVEDVHQSALAIRDPRSRRRR